MTHGHIHHGPMYDGARCRSEKITYTGTGVAQNITFEIMPDVIIIFGHRLSKFYHLWERTSDDSWRSGSLNTNPLMALDIVGISEHIVQVDLECNISPIVYEALGFMVSPNLFLGAYTMNYWTPGFHKHMTGFEDKYNGRLWIDDYVGDANAWQDKNMVFEPAYLIIIDHDDELVYHTLNPTCGVSKENLYTLLEGYNAVLANRILTVVDVNINSGIVNLGGELNQNGHIYTFINFGGLSSGANQKGGGGPGHIHKGGWDSYNRTLMGSFSYVGDGNASLSIQLDTVLPDWIVHPDLVVIFGEHSEISGDLFMAFKTFVLYGYGPHGPNSNSFFIEGPSPGAGVDYETNMDLYTNPGGKSRLKVYLAENLNTLGIKYNVWLIHIV